MIKIGKNADFTTLKRVIVDDLDISLDADDLKSVEESFNFLADFSKDKLIYGITTGLGPMAQYRINDNDRIELQYNLIRSHAAGIGKHLSPRFVKAGMLCRLMNILQANSGVHTESVLLLRDFINNGIFPVIFEHG